MSRESILEEMQHIFKDVLDNEDIVLTDDTTAEDIDEWDSLSQIQLIVALEEFFKVKLTAKEVMECDNIGDMVACIGRKLV